MKTHLHGMTEHRRVQLAAIARDAAGTALLADAKAKKLDASSVDLLRLVKARCRRCAPSAVLGVPLGPPRAPHTAALEYPGVCRMREYLITLGVLTQLSTVEHSLARADAGVLRRIVERSSVHAAAVAAVGYPKYG
jgi:hypothetical protein